MAPHVVVIGGGFAGLEAARALAGAPVRVTVVDKTNHHLFQPLLYQVATASLAPSDIAEPIRSILRHQENVAVRLAEVLRVDPAARTLRLRDDDGTEEEVPFDKLVVAAGATNQFFGNDAWEHHAPGLKTLGDALEIRRRILRAFERAEFADTPEERARHLTFVVIGGGATGVELAGAIAEIAFWTLRRDFRNVDLSKARVVLVEGGKAVLPAFSDRLRERGLEQLRGLGVEVRLDTKVTGIDASGVDTSGGRIPCSTVLWGAGVRGVPLAATLGVPLDRAGRVIVNADCAIPGHPDVFVAGDLAFFQHGGEPVPGVAPAAMQMGRFAGEAILADLAGRPRGSFAYWDKGSMATIGRRRAVAHTAWFETSGLLAWMMWAFIHVVFLITFRNRFLVMSKWAVAWFTYERASRLIWVPFARGEPATRPADAA